MQLLAASYIITTGNEKIVLVHDSNPGPADGIGLIFPEVMNNKVYFRVPLTSQGGQIAESDGDSYVKIISIDSVQGVNASLPLPVALGKAFGTHNGMVYFPALQNNKRSMYSYDPSSGKISYYQPLTHFTTGGSIVSYRNKLMYYDAGKTMLHDFKDTPKAIHAIDSTIKFHFHDHCFFIIHNDWLFGNGRIDGNSELFMFYDSTLSVNKLFATPLSVTAYPNPTTGDAYLDIDLKEPLAFSVTITDMNGRTVYTGPGALYSTGRHKIHIPLQQHPQGNYFYSIRTKETLLYSGRLNKL